MDVIFNNPSWYDWPYHDLNFHLHPRFGKQDSASEDIAGSTLSDQNLSLFAVVDNNYNLRCTDDRDRVYGLLGLANDVQEGDIAIDYNLTLKQIHTQFVPFMIRNLNSLQFMLYAGIGFEDSHMSRRTQPPP